MPYNGPVRVPLSLQERLEQAARERLEREGAPLPPIAERNADGFLRPRDVSASPLDDRVGDAIEGSGRLNPDEQRAERMSKFITDSRGRVRPRRPGE